MKKLIVLSLFIVLGTTANAQNGTNDKGYVSSYYSSTNSFTCNDGVLFVTSRFSSEKILVKFPQNKNVSSYTIPDGTYTIAKGAFKDNKYVKTIRIPSSVRFIGDNAFDGCDQLTSIEMYESTNSIRAAEADNSPSDAREVGRYNIQGLKIQEDEDGQVQIILYSDGTAKKVLK